ncbi:GGDEF domain-containing protein [Synechococcus sp. CBW1002]|jgi:diguanylate cyclase (GGDEF)-like protein|uniref:GGDEF domain-containing protein n=1 Tax=Synechococcus sp. CBW1002 TaxID=1353134 RepID=UPI0018CF34D0|nr:GGDEF domain-containing protein [Synechococcus sp. CBW1002]QPN59894.1 GGDEF domain-containing protein [Synechococcus sp. CBW1002]
MLDLDHFKRVNDTYGHASGDLVLEHFSQKLKGALRTSDTAGRLGGEEFFVLMRGTPLAGLTELAQRVRSAMAAEPVQLNGLDLIVTVSIGGCLEENSEDRILDSLARGDAALYRAKEAGRICVILDPGPGSA